MKKTKIRECQGFNLTISFPNAGLNKIRLRDYIGLADLGGSELSDEVIGRRLKIFEEEAKRQGAVVIYKVTNGGVSWNAVALTRLIDEKSAWTIAMLWDTKHFHCKRVILKDGNFKDPWTVSFKKVPSQIFLEASEEYTIRN